MRLDFEHSAEGLRVIIHHEFGWRIALDGVGTAFFLYLLSRSSNGELERRLIPAVLTAVGLFDMLWLLGGRETLELTPTQLIDRRRLLGVPIWARTYNVDELSGPHFDEGVDDEHKRPCLEFYTPSGTVKLAKGVDEADVERIIKEMETRFPELRTKWYSGAVGRDKNFTWLKLT